MVTVEEFTGELSRDDLGLTGVIISEDGSEQMVQEGSTASLIFGVPELIARLSEVITLLPGDLIFTGTPAGVATARTPKQFLQPGQTLVSRIAGIGEMRNRMV